MSGLTVVLVFVYYLFQNRTEQEDILSNRAVLKLFPFPKLVREVGFSRYTATKSKYHYRLDVAPDMRIQLSAITPKVKGFCETNNTILHTSSL
jgi:hypothetical protein